MMEHRNRHLMQHKVELSTLLKMAMSAKKNHQQVCNKITGQALVTALATKAIESLKSCDRSPAETIYPQINL